MHQSFVNMPPTQPLSRAGDSRANVQYFYFHIVGGYSFGYLIYSAVPDPRGACGSELFPLRAVPYGMINHFYHIECLPLNVTFFYYACADDVRNQVMGAMPMIITGATWYIGLDKQKFSSKIVIFSYPSILTYVLGAQKNRLIETVLLSIHIMCFG